MDEKIIRGYWDCKVCGEKHIDGLVDKCPNCGRQKSGVVHYYMGDKDDVVSEKELNKAGIKIEECDGNHKEWICPFCGSVNNWSDEECVSCKTLKDTSEHKESKILEEKSIYDYANDDSDSYKKKEIIKNIGYILVAALSIIFIVSLFFPYEVTQKITEFSWTRDIEIEELKTFSDSGWYLPDDARLHEARTEFYSYREVLDHYDSVPVTKTRQVQDGYETHTTYVDNGNGTFTEKTTQTPKYRTETYTEIEQKPVYRSEPVYKTKYYYEYDKWVETEHLKSSGKDKNPYWNTNYTLNDKQRDTKRTEIYTISLCDEKKNISEKNVDFETWQSYKIGDTFSITKCLIGIQYKKQLLD